MWSIAKVELLNLYITFGRMKGKIYIASMNIRGDWAPKPEGAIVLNVTSAQGKTKPERLDFSPMTPVPGGYKGFWNFEHYWQAGKVFEGFSEKENEAKNAWWKKQETPKKKYPTAKGLRVLHSIYPDGKTRGYIESRKEVYVPEYYELVKGRPSVEKWKRIVDSGATVIIYDFDGPRDSEGSPICLEFSEELFEEKINNVDHPFGHGYIVAAILTGIDIMKK